MDERSAGIESELLDLSTVNVATLRLIEQTGITAAIERAWEKIANAEGSISGYSGTLSSWTRPGSEGRVD